MSIVNNQTQEQSLSLPSIHGHWGKKQSRIFKNLRLKPTTRKGKKVNAEQTTWASS